MRVLAPATPADNKAATPTAVQVTAELFPGQNDNELLCVFQRRRGESLLFRDVVQAVAAELHPTKTFPPEASSG